MALTTETLIKRTLTRLFNLVMKWYEEHPEGRRDPKTHIDCYGSATFGVASFSDEERPYKIAHITMDGGNGEHVSIEAGVNGDYVDGQLYRNLFKR